MMGWVCRVTGWKFPRDFGCAASCLVRRIPTAVALAVLLWLVPFSSSNAQQVKVVHPDWCIQHSGNDLLWVTENKYIKPNEPYVLELSGDPGTAMLYFFGVGRSGSVYFVPISGLPRVLLPPMNILASATVNRGTISLPAYLIVYGDSVQGRFGHLEFEWEGKVTGTVELYWLTSNVTMQPVSALPEWNALERVRLGLAGAALPSKQIEFTLQFTGCPPLGVGLQILWVLADGSSLQTGAFADKVRLDRINLGGIPGRATVWVDEARLHQFPSGGTKLADWISFTVTNDEGTHPGFPIRKPFSITGMVGPNRIDLGFKKCWHEIDVEYTGGYPISSIFAYNVKPGTGGTGGTGPYEVRWQTQQRPLTGDALLQIEIPVYVATGTAAHTPSRVWVEVGQPMLPGAAGRVGFEVGVVNFPIPVEAAWPSGGCDWNAPSALPAHP
jgi:hypothetical protein